MSRHASQSVTLCITLVNSDSIAYCHFNGLPKITKIFWDSPQPIDTVPEYPVIYGILFEAAGNYRRNIYKVDHIGVYSMGKE